MITEQKKLYLEPYQLSEFYTLYDLAENSPGERQMFEVWSLWVFIQKCFPKIDLENEKWVIGFDSIFKPHIFDIGRRKNDPR